MANQQKTPEERIGINEKGIEMLEKTCTAQFGNIWETIDEIKRRPPVWVTAVISLLTFFLGGAVTCIGIILRFRGSG